MEEFKKTSINLYLWQHDCIKQTELHLKNTSKNKPSSLSNSSLLSRYNNVATFLHNQYIISAPLAELWHIICNFKVRHIIIVISSVSHHHCHIIIVISSVSEAYVGLQAPLPPSSLWKNESSLWERAAGVSNSTTFPACITMTLSESMMVLSLCTWVWTWG